MHAGHELCGQVGSATFRVDLDFLLRTWLPSIRNLYSEESIALAFIGRASVLKPRALLQPALSEQPVTSHQG